MRDYYSDYVQKLSGFIPASRVSKVSEGVPEASEAAIATFDTDLNDEEIQVIQAEREAIRLEGCGQEVSELIEFDITA